jgi:hypothetical protein
MPRKSTKYKSQQSRPIPNKTQIRNKIIQTINEGEDAIKTYIDKLPNHSVKGMVPSTLRMIAELLEERAQNIKKKLSIVDFITNIKLNKLIKDIISIKSKELSNSITGKDTSGNEYITYSSFKINLKSIITDFFNIKSDVEKTSSSNPPQEPASVQQQQQQQQQPGAQQPRQRNGILKKKENELENEIKKILTKKENYLYLEDKKIIFDIAIKKVEDLEKDAKELRNNIKSIDTGNKSGILKRFSKFSKTYLQKVDANVTKIEKIGTTLNRLKKDTEYKSIRAGRELNILLNEIRQNVESAEYFYTNILEIYEKVIKEASKKASKKADQERLARERLARAEEEAREKAEQERLAREKAEQERLARVEEQERLAREGNRDGEQQLQELGASDKQRTSYERYTKILNGLAKYLLFLPTKLASLNITFIPRYEKSGNYDMFQFMLYILIAIFFVIFIFMMITFSLEEDVRKLKRNCKREEKEQKCSINKKCLLKEVALGTEIKKSIDKCLK